MKYFSTLMFLLLFAAGVVNEIHNSDVISASTFKWIIVGIVIALFSVAAIIVKTIGYNNKRYRRATSK